MSHQMFTSLILQLILFLCISYSTCVQVDTEYGPVEGDTITLHSGITVHSFLGIPYAKAPIADLRWKAPEPPTSWEDVFVADTLGNSCQQQIPGMHIFTHPGWNNLDEDCLNLNIFMPESLIDGPYPVMVWIHGGRHQEGSNIQYPGHFLAARDVVVVVPNYRLGIFGFGSTKDETAPGNYGMLDQVFALQWVQENIANFGGDPDQVTIFGESAGGASVGVLLVSPFAQGLFHKAILQSGCELAYWAINNPDDDQNYMIQVADNVGCPVEDGDMMIECLREINPIRLMRSNITCTLGYNCMWKPRVDGSFLPDRPRNLRESGNYNKVPEIIGINSEDGHFFIPPLTWLGVNRTRFEDFFAEAIEDIAPRFTEEDREEDMRQAALFQYTPWPYLHDEELNRDAIGRFETDGTYGQPANEQAKLHSKDGSDTYFYVLNYRAQQATLPHWMGCTHMGDLPYIFGYPFLPLNEAVRNNSDMWFDFVDFDDSDREFSSFMTTLWTNFAKFSNPTPSPVEPPVGDTGAVTWPLFTPDDLAYLWIGADLVESRSNYRQEYYAFMQFYYPWLAYGRDIPFGELKF